MTRIRHKQDEGVVEWRDEKLTYVSDAGDVWTDLNADYFELADAPDR